MSLSPERDFCKFDSGVLSNRPYDSPRGRVHCTPRTPVYFQDLRHSRGWGTFSCGRCRFRHGRTRYATEHTWSDCLCVFSLVRGLMCQKHTIKSTRFSICGSTQICTFSEEPFYGHFLFLGLCHSCREPVFRPYRRSPPTRPTLSPSFTESQGYPPEPRFQWTTPSGTERFYPSNVHESVTDLRGSPSPESLLTPIED